ncbi:hypothetical protein N9W07_00095 [Alphaproteobacteria bacterium]|nr:hypothetical protein [Alphaproteobacteria bacterium]
MNKHSKIVVNAMLSTLSKDICCMILNFDVVYFLSVITQETPKIIVKLVEGFFIPLGASDVI